MQSNEYWPQHQNAVLHEGYGINRRLMEADEERDLGIFVTSDLKPSLQCVKAANKAMSVLGMVRRNF